MRMSDWSSDVCSSDLGTPTQAAFGGKNMGQVAYEAYKLRAVFPEYVSDALEYFMGSLHNKSPVIELPEEMEDLRNNATPLGEPLEILLQRINLEQLTTGRVGIQIGRESCRERVCQTV